MDEPLISIVTPSYNQRRFIEETLVSVMNQDYPAVEHIVVDGESTDGTLDILRDYEDEYNLTWLSEPDDGQSDAINKGFELADGDIVAWLNSDDVYFDTGVFGRVAQYFQRFTADVIYGDLVYLNEGSTVQAVDVRPSFDITKLPYRILIGQPATFFSRSVVEAETLDISLEYSMDYEYWLRLSNRFEFRHVTDILAGFRSYEAQKSQDQEAMAAELQDILSEYQVADRHTLKVLFSNLTTETVRLVRALHQTLNLHREPPPLAFDGEIAPLSVMLRNLGPGYADFAKAWRRWRSGGASG